MVRSKTSAQRPWTAARTVTVAAVLLAATGCVEDLGCWPQIQEKRRYAVTVLEPYDDNTPYAIGAVTRGETCGDSMAYPNGLSLEIQVYEKQYCSSSGSVEGAPDVTFLGPPVRGAIGEVFHAAYPAVHGSCAGNWELWLLGYGDLFSRPLAGKLPPVVLWRTFDWGAADAGVDCPPVVTGTSWCAGAYVVELTPR